MLLYSYPSNRHRRRPLPLLSLGHLRLSPFEGQFPQTPQSVISADRIYPHCIRHRIASSYISFQVHTQYNPHIHMSQYFNSPPSSSKQSFFLTYNIWRANTILAYIHLSITLTWTNSPSLSFPCHPSTLHFLICCVVAYIHSLPVNRVFVCLFFIPSGCGISIAFQTFSLCTVDVFFAGCFTYNFLFFFSLDTMPRVAEYRGLCGGIYPLLLYVYRLLTPCSISHCA